MRKWIHKWRYRLIRWLLADDLERLYQLAKDANLQVQEARKKEAQFSAVYFAGQRDAFWVSAHWLDHIRPQDKSLTLEEMTFFTTNLGMSNLRKENV